MNRHLPSEPAWSRLRITRGPISTRYRCAGVFVALCMLSMIACDGSSGDELWEAALRVDQTRRERLLPAVERGAIEQGVAHARQAEALTITLRRFPGSSESGVRQVLEEIRDTERSLADGELAGDEADDLRRRNEQYWSYLRKGELPPNYR